MRQALPELPFDNVAAAVVYYRDVLGFRVNHQQDDLGVMYRDAITVLLIARTERHKGIGSFDVYVENADVLHEELLAKAHIFLDHPVSHPWGLREFSILDLEGNRITFGKRSNNEARRERSSWLAIPKRTFAGHVMPLRTPSIQDSSTAYRCLPPTSAPPGTCAWNKAEVEHHRLTCSTPGEGTPVNRCRARTSVPNWTGESTRNPLSAS